MSIMKKFSSAGFSAFFAVAFLLTQLLTPLLFVQDAFAAPGDLTASTHQGQLNPSGTYTNGNVTSYVENDSINFRFTLDSTGATSGQMAINFTDNGNSCNFFDGTFSLGTHDGSSSAIVSNSGVTPTVTPNGAPVSGGSDWTQLLDVSFTGTGNATVYYYLTLSDTSSNCNGSSQRSTLANSQTPGDFGNMGRESVPVAPPAPDTNPATITATKYFDEDNDGQGDRRATAGEWAFSLNRGAPVQTDANGQVVFEVNESDSYLITEAMPDGYEYVSSRGDNCVNGQNPGQMIATVVVSPNGNQNAECNFLNRPVERQTATVMAYKVVCRTEADLPNWSGGAPGATNGPVPSQITATTAQEYVDQSDGNCRFTDGWDFQWGYRSQQGQPGVQKLAGNYVGPAPTGPGYNQWKNFDSGASGSNPAVVQIGDTQGASSLWVRENLKDGYVPFVNPPGPLRSDNISAEIYCHTDILNYDNFDRVDGLELGNTYYCVAFNAPTTGSLTVEKQSQPQDPQDFGFRVTNNDGFSQQFYLDDDGNPNNALPNSETLNNLQPGIYQIQEQTVDGWQLAGVRCNNERVNTDNNSVWVEVVAGENLRCVFTNQKDGELKIVKNAVPNDEQDFRFRISRGQEQQNFVLDDDPKSGTPRMRTFQTAPGVYQISEAREEAWILYRIDCGDAQAERDGNSIRVRVNPGQEVRCVFVNVKRGSITIMKDARPNYDQDFNFRIGRGDETVNFTLNDDGQGDENVRVFENARPGNYWVREYVPEGWDLQNIRCNVDSDRKGSRVDFRLRPGGAVVCEFINVGRGSITIVKDAQPESDQLFEFVGTRKSTDKRIEFTLQDNGDNKDDYQSREHFEDVRADVYHFREKRIEGWDLARIACYERYDNDRLRGDVPISLNQLHQGHNGLDYDREGRRVSFQLEPGQDIICRFVNVERGDVKVTKFNDVNQNGRYDEGEETLEGWDMTLASRRIRHGNPTITNDISNGDGHHGHGQKVTQTTGENGMTTFEDVSALERVRHRLSETQQDGWNLSNMYCERDRDIRDEIRGSIFAPTDDHEEKEKKESIRVPVRPGKTTECFVGNYPDPELTIAKANDKPEPTTTGDTVTYTIEVTNPEDSSCVFGYPADKNCAMFEEEPEEMPYYYSLAEYIEEEHEEEGYTAVTVTDLPPAGFDYVPGSYTANSNVRGDLKAQGITTEPTYASPGVWNLTSALSNFLLPGEIVTLTYQATIANSVTVGTYPDSAFALGFGSGGQDVYANVAQFDNPFVGSDVTIIETQDPQGFVLGQTLVNTGFPAYVQVFLGVGIAGAAVLTTMSDRLKKMFKKAAKPLATLLVVVGMFVALGSPVNAFQSWELNVVDLPEVTNSSSINLAYQVSTVDASNEFKVTAKQNGVPVESQVVITPFGDARSFPIGFAGEGNYELEVTAEVTSGGNAGETMTKTMNIEYDAATPQTPTFNGKTRNGNTWTISFTVPAGSGTENVQIFASTSSSFTADNSTLVGEVSATPGTAQTFSYTAPDGAERFFAVRAVDAAGNESALTGDSETVVATSSTSTTAATTSTDGSGSESTDGQGQEEGEVLSESEIDLSGEFDNEEDGESNNNIIWLLIALLALGVAGGIYWQTRNNTEE